MKESQQFGARLKELRLLALLTQRQLAEKIGVDFSYLSKIENGVLPPPSEKVILQLAEVLNADNEELLILAGKIPADIAEMLKNRKTLELLRSDRTRKKVMAKKANGVTIMKKIQNLSKVTKESLPRIPVNYRNLARVAIAITLVIMVGTSLWFVSPQPVKALDITYPSLPSSGTLGSTYTFTLTITVASSDLLPVDHINVEIYNASNPSSYKATLASLPLGDQTLQAHTITEGSGSGTVQVSASADSEWGVGTSGGNGGRHGYGYREPAGWGYHDPLTGLTGYGYGTSPFTGVAASITYTIQWGPPSSWPTGSYKVKALVYGDSTNKFSGTSSSFTLSAAAAAPPAAGAEPPAPDVEDIADVIDENGVFTEAVTVESSDGNVEIVVPSGTTGQTSTGEPLSEITIQRVDPPEPPPDTDTIGIDYDLGPDGATFDPAILITFQYYPTQIPAGGSAENLSIAYYDPVRGWVELDAADIEIDLATNTITASIRHFTYFSVIAHTAPAEFSVGSLTISPSEANIAQMVTISTTVTNTGDLTGKFDAVLKINGQPVATKTVTIAGGAAEKVTFGNVQGAAGTYTVEISGQTGNFTVKSVSRPVIITSPPVTVPAPPTPPAPAPTAPTAPKITEGPPAPPTPAPPINWVIIIIIAIAAIIVAGAVIWYSARR